MPRAPFRSLDLCEATSPFDLDSPVCDHRSTDDQPHSVTECFAPLDVSIPPPAGEPLPLAAVLATSSQEVSSPSSFVPESRSRKDRSRIALSRKSRKDFDRSRSNHALVEIVDNVVEFLVSDTLDFFAKSPALFADSVVPAVSSVQSLYSSFVSSGVSHTLLANDGYFLPAKSMVSAPNSSAALSLIRKPVSRMVVDDYVQGFRSANFRLSPELSSSLSVQRDSRDRSGLGGVPFGDAPSRR